MITLFLLILAGMCNAVMDTLFSHYDISIFKKFNPLFWNPEVSWKNKWAQPYPQPAEDKWYYFGFVPPYKERFPYSSTIFVFLTDAWHLFKFFMLTFIFLGVVLYTPMVSKCADFFIYYIAYTFTFTMFYDYVLVRKEYRD